MHSRLSQWWNEISIRTKITGITVALVTLGLLVAGLGTMTVLSTYLYAQVNTNLSTAAKSIHNISKSGTYCTAQFGYESTSYLAIVDSDGTLFCDNKQDLDSGTNPYLPRLHECRGREAHEAFTAYNKAHTQEWRLYSIREPRSTKTTGETTTYTVVTGTNLAETNNTIARFTYIFFGFGLSVVVLGAAITRLLVTSTFAPLRDVEDTAARFADGDFSQRLDTTTPNTEVGRLNRSLNTMLSRIDSRLRRPREDHRPDAALRRRRQPRAAHAAGLGARLRRALSHGRPAEARRRRPGHGPHRERGHPHGRAGGGPLELARLDEAKPLELGPVDLVPIARDSALDTMASNTDREIRVIVREPVEPGDDSPEEYVVPRAVVTAAGSPNVTGPIAFAGATLARLRTRRARATAAGVTPPEDLPRLDPATEKAISPVVLGEENKIRQVVTNLMGNAMRFTDYDAPIELAVQADPGRGMATIDVIDHGEGIPPQIREKIFQRFWRADTSRTRDTGGSGLGLAIVSGIVAAHHGDVDVFDTPGGGATFRVSLPLFPAAD